VKFDRLIVEPSETGFTFRIYLEGANPGYVNASVTTADAWHIVEFIQDVERTRKLVREEFADAEG
jgi:hypothetical protein